MDIKCKEICLHISTHEEIERSDMSFETSWGRQKENCKVQEGEGEHEEETYWQRMRETERRGRVEEEDCKSEKEWKRLIGERKKSLTYTPHLDMVLVSFAKKLLMWHEERELAFQRREKCLLALLVKEKGLRYTPHISSLFGDFAVASTFYLPPYLFSFFFFHFLIHSVCSSSPQHFPGTQLQRLAGYFWIDLFQNNLWQYSFG